jgi:hypothetical protein
MFQEIPPGQLRGGGHKLHLAPLLSRTSAAVSPAKSRERLNLRRLSYRKSDETIGAYLSQAGEGVDGRSATAIINVGATRRRFGARKQSTSRLSLNRCTAGGI